MKIALKGNQDSKRCHENIQLEGKTSNISPQKNFGIHFDLIFIELNRKEILGVYESRC